MAKAQVGDLIRITNVPEDWAYPNGAIYEVYGIAPAGTDGHSKDAVKFTTPQLDEGTNYYAYDDQYEIFRKAGEEDDVGACASCGAEVIGGNHVSEPAPGFTCDITDTDTVNSPNHYTQGRFETIEIIEEITKGYEDGYVAYCVGNALKYLARAPFKHGEPTEDLAKAERYLAFANAYLTQTTE